MGFLNSLLNAANELSTKMQENAAKVQEYKNEYAKLSDQKLLDELNRQRREKDDFFNDNASLRITALKQLFEERGYYITDEGRLRKR